MVRINLITPKNLADQHLIAEYNEILIFFGYLKRHKKIKEMPKHYVLGKGHILFFKNKLKYLQKRFELIKIEMKRRGFHPRKSLSLSGFNREYIKDWKPRDADFRIIKKRIIQRIKSKPKWYRYYGEYKHIAFFIKLINS